MIMRLSKSDSPSHIIAIMHEIKYVKRRGTQDMPEHTALYSLEKLLALRGLDDLEKMKAEVNPFWNRARLDVAWSLPVMSGLTQERKITVHPMREATRNELLSFHDSSYVETLELFGNTGSAFSARFGLDTPDCPVFQDVHKYASLPVGAVLDATIGVSKGKFKNAISYIGGFHHAMESKASGFCYLNDTVIAIKKYKELNPGKKVLYLDTDVHHGDGTQMAFYDDPDVLTISLHELSMGFYPETGIPEENGIGEGKGYSVNIPLPPLTDDVEYWKAFEDVVVPIWLAYKPDFVMWNIGVDAHVNDPLADLMLTYDTYHRLSTTIRQLVHLGTRKIVAVGGGGYEPVTTAKVWTIVLADLADIALPPILPAEWITLAQKYGFQMRRGGWTDRPRRLDDEHYPNVSRAVDDSIKKVKGLIFPIFGIE